MLHKNKLIAALLSAAVTFSLIPGGAIAAAGVDDDELFLNLVEQVVIKVNDDTMIKLGKRVDFTETDAGVPHYVDGNLVVPIRFFQESFYGDIDYDPFGENATITFDRGIFKFAIGEKEFEFEGEKKTFSVAPFLMDNRIYVPLNDFAKLIEMSVTYGQNGIVIVSPLANIKSEYFTTPVYNVIDRILTTEITEEVVLYVAVDGKPDATGTKDDPFDRVESARDKIRELKKDGIERNYKVIIGEGTYDIKEPVVFTTEDSATISTTIEYVAEEGADVEFATGYTLDNWQKYDDNIYMVELPEKRTDLWWVFEDGVVGKKSRYPNEGYTLSNNPANVFDYHTYREDVPDLEWKPDLQIGSYMGGSGGEWMWTWFYRYVTKIDKENKIFKMSDVIWGKHPSYPFGKGTKYALFNSLELIDVPGECYYDRETNILYYYPRNPDRINNVIIPRPINILEFRSDNKDKLIRNITVDGIQTNGTDWVSERAFVDNKLLHVNYPETAGHAVLVQNGAGITVKNSKFNNIAVNALNLKNNCYNCKLEGCDLNNIGSSVYGTSGYISATAKEVDVYKYNNHDRGYSYRSFISFENCLISEAAQFTLTSSAFSPSGPYFHLANCHISDMRRSGVNFAEDSLANVRGTVLEYNTFTNCMYDSQDGSPIYTGGVGGTVRHNYVYKNGTNTGIMTYMYLDDDTHYMKFYKNLYIDLSMDVELSASHGQPAISLKSLSNKVYNNIMDDLNSYAGLTMNKQPWERPEDATFKNNVITDAYSRTTGEFEMYDSIMWDEKLLREFDGNVVYNEVGKYDIGFPTISSLDDLRNAFEGKFAQKEVIGVKPAYMDEDKDDYRMRYDSIAYATGFEDLKISKSGLREDYPFADDTLPLETLYVKRKGDFADKATVLLKKGGTAELEFVGRTGGPRYRRTPEAKFLTYTSDNTAVATVSNGVIKAQGEGKAKITITYNDGKSNISTSIYVFVDDFAIDKYVVYGHEDGSPVQKDVDISGVSGTTPFIYTISKYGRIMPINERKTSFELEDKIANVEKDGRITGVETGFTTLNVNSLVTDSDVEELKINVRVVSDFYSGMYADTPSNGIKLGEKVEIIGSATSRRTGEINNVPISIESTDETVLKVSKEEDGKCYVEAVGVGTANIIAKYTEVASNHITSTITMYVLGEEDMDLYGYKFRDVGACPIPGSIREVENGRFKMYSSGIDVYSANDEFSFLRKEHTGNAEVIVTVDSVENVHASTAVGLMFRVDDTAHAYNIHYRIKPNGGTLVTWKSPDAPNSTNKSGKTLTFPATLKLTRENDVFKCYYLDENGVWVENITVKLELPKTLLVGLAGFSRHETKEACFELSNFQFNDIGYVTSVEVDEDASIGEE